MSFAEQLKSVESRLAVLTDPKFCEQLLRLDEGADIRLVEGNLQIEFSDGSVARVYQHEVVTL